MPTNDRYTNIPLIILVAGAVFIVLIVLIYKDCARSDELRMKCLELTKDALNCKDLDRPGH